MLALGLPVYSASNNFVKTVFYGIYGTMHNDLTPVPLAVFEEYYNRDVTNGKAPGTVSNR